MLYIIAWLTIIFCFIISLLSLGVYLTVKYPDSSFTIWFKENILDEDPDEEI